MTNLSLAQLRHAVTIKERIDGLQSELNQLLGTSAPAASVARASVPGSPVRGRKRSAAVRARMAAAQRARWAKKGKGASAAPAAKSRMSVAAPAASAKKRKRYFSPEALARISAAAKARWAKAKASGKRRLG